MDPAQVEEPVQIGKAIAGDDHRENRGGVVLLLTVKRQTGRRPRTGRDRRFAPRRQGTEKLTEMPSVLSHRRQEVGKVTRPLGGNIGVRKVVALDLADEAAGGPEHSVDDHTGVRCGVSGSDDRIIPVSVSRGHDDEYTTPNRRVPQYLQHRPGIHHAARLVVQER